MSVSSFFSEATFFALYLTTTEITFYYYYLQYNPTMLIFIQGKSNIFCGRCLRRYIHLLRESPWGCVAFDLHAASWKQPSYSAHPGGLVAMDFAYYHEVRYSN